MRIVRTYKYKIEYGTAGYATSDNIIYDFKQPDCKVRVGEYAMYAPEKGDNLDKYNPEYGNLYYRKLDGSLSEPINICGPIGAPSAYTLNGIHPTGVLPEYYDFHPRIGMTLQATLGYGGTDDAQEVINITTFSLKPADIINSLNNFLPRTKLEAHPSVKGLPVIIGLEDVEDISASSLEDYPNFYYIFDWSSDKWYYGGQFQSISIDNIIKVTKSDTDIASGLVTLVPGGIMLFETEEAASTICTQQSQAYHPYSI
jgi:hypothetical protein